ncbi:hypothetical protein AVEN_36221-1 [Araneus ventricosus]|uniref:Uncharacterized protein n=1 Tax=Araneus ventricosus TaxID=182803 RepID=A0A4Y2QKG2_ARAVE|nr:hypothetical protein AVEN_36221-1 [Araneus ventricosus]
MATCAAKGTSGTSLIPQKELNRNSSKVFSVRVSKLSVSRIEEDVFPPPRCPGHRKLPADVAPGVLCETIPADVYLDGHRGDSPPHDDVLCAGDGRGRHDRPDPQRPGARLEQRPQKYSTSE